MRGFIVDPVPPLVHVSLTIGSLLLLVWMYSFGCPARSGRSLRAGIEICTNNSLVECVRFSCTSLLRKLEPKNSFLVWTSFYPLSFRISIFVYLFNLLYFRHFYCLFMVWTKKLFLIILSF